jgi:type III pantothenate kinase
MNGSMLILIDVGNTNTVFGLSDETSAALSATFRFASARDRTADEWYGLITPLIERSCPNLASFKGMIISSVVPAITGPLLEVGRRYFSIEPMIVGAELELGVRIEVDSPSEVGSDRLVNAAMAFEMYGGPVIVVDLGTATKIEAVTESGVYRGGVIAPGIGLSLETLAGRAAKLYAVELRPSDQAIGKNTIAAVQSGVVNGHIAMIEGMVSRVSIELGMARHVVMTGGFSSLVIDHTSLITDHVPDLTLLGLRHVLKSNRELSG